MLQYGKTSFTCTFSMIKGSLEFCPETCTAWSSQPGRPCCHPKAAKWHMMLSQGLALVGHVPIWRGAAVWGTIINLDKPLCSRFHLIKLPPEVVHCLPHVHQSYMLISKVSLFFLVTSLNLFSCFVPISCQLLDIERKLLIGRGGLF